MGRAEPAKRLAFFYIPFICRRHAAASLHIPLSRLWKKVYTVGGRNSLAVYISPPCPPNMQCWCVMVGVGAKGKNKSSGCEPPNILSTLKFGGKGVFKNCSISLVAAREYFPSTVKMLNTAHVRAKWTLTIVNLTCPSRCLESTMHLRQELQGLVWLSSLLTYADGCAVGDQIRVQALPLHVLREHCVRI